MVVDHYECVSQFYGIVQLGLYNYYVFQKVSSNVAWALVTRVERVDFGYPGWPAGHTG
jgi:hypothetical protein